MTVLRKNTFVNIVKENIENFSRQSFFDKCDSISFALLFLFFIDCGFSGGGKYLAIGPVSFRMAVAAAALIFAIPKLLLNVKKYMKNPIFYMFLAFLIYLIFSALMGLKADNNINVLISDIKGFMWLFTVPALVITIDNKKRFACILNAIVIGALIQAAIVLVIHFVSCLIKDGIKYFYQPMLDLQIGTVSIISNNVFRIFMRSSPYMILACSIVFFKQLKQEKLKVKYILSIALFLFCVLLSFTRSLFGCVFVVFVCMIAAVLIFYRNKIKLMLKTLACVAVSVLVCVGIMEFAFDASYLNFAISRTLGTPVKQSFIVTAKYEIKNIDWENIFSLKDPDGDSVSQGDNASSEVNSDEPATDSNEPTTDSSEPTTDSNEPTTDSNESTTDSNEPTTDSSEPTTDNDKQNQIEEDFRHQQNYIEKTQESDNLRAVTKQELRSLIAKSPIIGNGLGACSETRNGPDEYFYYDMLARMGIIGLLLYVAPFIYVCIYMLKKKSLISSNMKSVSLICGVLGFWAVTWFNPWMNAALGIAVYSLSCSIIEVFKSES